MNARVLVALINQACFEFELHCCNYASLCGILETSPSENATERNAVSQQVQIRPGLLKRLRDMSGINSDEAQARMLGFDRTTIYRIEQGAQPSAAFMASVCTTYGIGLGEAFEIIENESAKAA